MNTSIVQPETLYESSYLSIYYYEEKFLHVEWKGYLSVEQVKEGCEIVYRYVQEKQNFLGINDNRKVKGSWTQAIRWLEQNFMPRIIKEGYEKIAYLYSPHPSARYSVDRLLEVNDKYEAQTFESFQEATRWLIGKEIAEQENNPSILIKTLDRYTKIYLNEIYYISRQNGQTIIQTAHQTHITRKSLSECLKLLPTPDFFRIHKSHIVNISKIKSLKYHEGGYYHLFLNDFGNIYLTVSRNYVKDLKALLVK